MKSEERVITNYSFFSTLKISIFQFDKYYEIMQQKTRRMLLFLFEIIVLVALVLTGTIFFRVNSMCDYVYKFVQENLPEFTITEEGFKMDIEEPLIYKNSEYINSVVVFDNNDDNKKYLDEANKINSVYLVFTKNSLVFKIPGAITTEYKFSELLKPKTPKNTTNEKEQQNNTNNVTENVTENTTTETKDTSENKLKIDKNYILKIFNQDALRETLGNLMLYLFLLLFMSLLLISLINIIALSILGWVFAKIIKLPLKYSRVFNMAVAASALPTILLCIYMIVNIFTGFIIERFELLYALLTYIYLGAALLILRSNLVKTKNRKEEKVAAETGSSNVEVTIEDSEDDSEDDEEDEEDSEEEK